MWNGFDVAAERAAAADDLDIVQEDLIDRDDLDWPTPRPALG
jgi:hypothetical protein